MKEQKDNQGEEVKEKTMKVYIAKRHYDYRKGFTIIGVYETEEAAEKACSADEEGDTVGDSWEVKDFEVES